jgi:Outer membrane lipoprotein-sorting protein
MPLPSLIFRHLALSVLCFLALASAGQAQPSGQDLAQAVHDRPVGQDVTALQTLELIDPGGQRRIREMSLTGADDSGLRRTMLRFTVPADIAGTGFLAIEDSNGETEQFLYLPALKRARRIVSGQKGRSFVNTDFTFEDLERRPVNESEHVVTGETAVREMPCWILESRPKPGTESQYTLVKTWVAKDSAVPLQVDFYGKGPEPIKRYTVQQLENIQDIWTETQVSMEDLLSGHKTTLATREVTYNKGIAHTAFTTQMLEKW